MTGFGFWTPLFLGGLGLLVLPCLIHRIRRPERDTVRFSSLLFLPNIKQEVIERRRVQHPLLMLVRMLLLLLLAVAFARPYLLADPLAPEKAERIHLILIDHSLSTSGTLGEARRQVADLLDTLPPEDRVGLMAFDRQTEIIVPITDPTNPEAGSPSAVRAALDRVHPTWKGTDYVAALAAAERHLLTASSGDTTTAMTLHLVSDFQESGIRETGDGWRLSGSIIFVPHELPSPPVDLVIADSRIVKQHGTHRIKTRVRNTSDTDLETPIRVILEDRPLLEETLSVSAGDTRQFAAELNRLDDRPVHGLVAAGVDSDRDDVHYFAWNPPRKPRVAISPQTDALTRNLVRAALPTDRLDVVTGDESSSPSLIVSDRFEDLDKTMLSWLEAGGSILLAPDPRSTVETWNQMLADRTGVSLKAFRPEPATLSEIDLSHPVFAPLSGPRFNDFSAIRFTGSLPATLTDDSEANVVATFDGSGPAIVESAVGEGRLILWLFGISPRVTSLSRSPRFVPLIQETVDHLIRVEAPTTQLLVGDLVPVGSHTLKSRNSEPTVVHEGDRLSSPGWLVSEQDDIVRSVNVDPDETDLTRIPTVEFQLRLCHGSPATAQADGPTIIPGEEAPRVEHGYLVLLLVGCFLLIENAYAARLETA